MKTVPLSNHSILRTRAGEEPNGARRRSSALARNMATDRLFSKRVIALEAGIAVISVAQAFMAADTRMMGLFSAANVVAVSTAYLLVGAFATKTLRAARLYQALAVIFIVRSIAFAVWLRANGHGAGNWVEARFLSGGGASCFFEFPLFGFATLAIFALARLAVAVSLGVNRVTVVVSLAALAGVLVLAMNPERLEMISVGEAIGSEWLGYGARFGGCVIQ